MSFTNIFRGARGLSQPPIDDIETYWTPMEKAQAMRMLARSIVGSPDTVRKGIAALVEETGADELIVVSDVYDHVERLRSFELIAEAGGPPRTPLADVGCRHPSVPFRANNFCAFSSDSVHVLFYPQATEDCGLRRARDRRRLFGPTVLRRQSL